MLLPFPFEADLSHKNMEIVKTEDIKQEAIDIVKMSSGIALAEQMTSRSNIPLDEVGLGSMKYDENVVEEKNLHDPKTSIKIESDDIKDEIDIGEPEINYEVLKSIKIEDAFYKRNCGNECISCDKLEPDNGECIKDLKIIKFEPSEGTYIFDDMESQNTVMLFEHNYCKYRIGDIMRDCKYKNIQQHIKPNTRHSDLLNTNMEITHSEDIKEVINIVDSSSVKACSDIEYVEHINHKCNIPSNKECLESIKREESDTSYDGEMRIKSEITDIKDEEDLEELGLSYEQVEPFKIEEDVYKRDCSNECMQHTRTKSCISLNNLKPDNKLYIENMEMIKPESDEENHTSDDIEIDLEKQNTVLQWEHDYCKYEIRDVTRHSNHENNIQQHKCHLQQQESNFSYKNMDIFKPEDVKEEVIVIVDLSSTCRSDIRFNEVGLASMKYEEIVEEKNAYETEIKTEIDIKSEVDTKELDLGYEQLKSINSRYAVHTGDCSDECMEHTSTECHVSLDKLEPERHYINNTETIEFVENEEDASNDIEVNEYTNNIPQHTYPDPAEKTVLHTQFHETHKRDMKYFKCTFCEYITDRMDHLKSHFRTRHIENGELYKRPYCKYTSRTRKDFITHTKQKHNEDAELHQCKICDFKTKYKRSLLQHHILKHDKEKVFYCELCDFKTKYKQCFSQHHTIKHRDAAEIFCCELCDFKTKYKQSLSQHHTMKHDDAAKIFHCEMCDFKTKDKYYLLYRHRLKHDDSAEYFHCELCDFKTKYKYSFLYHVRKHDDAAEMCRRIVCHCKLCDFKTKYKYILLKHYKAKHEKGF